MLVILVVPPLQISTIWWIAVCPEAQRGWILPWWSPTGIISRHFHQQQLHLANASTLTRYAKTPFPLKDRRVAPAGVVRRSSRSGEAPLRPCASAFQWKPCEYLLKRMLRKPLFLSVHKFVASPARGESTNVAGLCSFLGPMKYRRRRPVWRYVDDSDFAASKKRRTCSPSTFRLLPFYNEMFTNYFFFRRTLWLLYRLFYSTNLCHNWWSSVDVEIPCASSCNSSSHLALPWCEGAGGAARQMV